MRSNLGRFHRPMSRGAMGDMLTMNSLGDGSTLSLDFTTGVLDPRLTFSRASTATFVNSSGYVEYAGANLVRQSGDLSQNGVGEWTTRTNLTLTGWSGNPDPFGGSTAVIIIPNTTNATHHVGTADISMSIGIPYTVSVYAKASGYSIVGLVTTNSNARAHFNLANQTSAGYGVTNTRTITDVGGGWYKLTMSFTVANGPLVSLLIYAMNTATDPVANSFAGVSASSDGVLAWGAQINPGSTVQTYYPTTTTAYHAPRFDYNPTNIGQLKGLLIETQNVNKALDSESLPATANPYLYNGTTRTVQSSDPNPRGTLGSISFAPTANGSNNFFGPSIAGFLTTSKVTFSIWVKANGTNSGVFLLFCSGVLVNSSGVVISQPAGASASFTGNGTVAPTISNLSATGWTRIAVTTDVNFSGVGNFDAFLYPKAISGQLTTDSLYIWGAQAEQSSNASSYIPTGGSTVTRAADTAIIAAGTNFSSWYTGGTSGTFVANWYGSASSTTARSVVATSDQTTKHLHLYQTPSALTLRLADFTAAATVTTGNNLTANALTKGAFSYASTATSLCLNGGTVATGTLAFTVAPTWLSIGGPSLDGTTITDTTVMLNNSIRTLKYFPARLSDAQIKEITT